MRLIVNVCVCFPRFRRGWCETRTAPHTQCTSRGSWRSSTGGHVSVHHIFSFHLGTADPRGQVRSGQVRSGQVRSGQVKSGQVNPTPHSSLLIAQTKILIFLQSECECFDCFYGVSSFHPEIISPHII